MLASIEIAPLSSVLEYPGFKDWCQEYADELANPFLPAPGAQIENWKDWDKEGRLRCIAVFDTGVLAGLIILLVSRSGHYPYPVIGLDSFYLRKPWRKGRLGLDLWGAAKAVAKREGAPGFCVMAPPGSKLEKLCELKGMPFTHKAFWCAV